MKSNLAILFLASLLFLACGKKGISFNMNHQANFRVETTAPLNLPFEIGTPDVTTNSSQEFKNNNTAPNLIKEVKLESLNLTITAPSGKTFSFLKSVEIFISTNSNNEIKLASAENISSTSSVLTLTASDANLIEYIKAEKYKLRSRIVTKETVTQTIDLRSDARFKITAKIL
jgi:hypothetical protein